MSTALARYRITAAEFARMGEAGVFPPESRLELVDGGLSISARSARATATA